MLPLLSQGFSKVPSVIAGQFGLFWHHGCVCNATPAFICGQRQYYDHQGQQGAPVVKDTVSVASVGLGLMPYMLASLHSADEALSKTMNFFQLWLCPSFNSA